MNLSRCQKKALAVFTGVFALMFGIDKIRMRSETRWGVQKEGE